MPVVSQKCHNAELIIRTFSSRRNRDPDEHHGIKGLKRQSEITKHQRSQLFDTPLEPLAE